MFSQFLNKDKAATNTVQAESLPRHVTMVSDRCCPAVVFLAALTTFTCSLAQDVDVACADLPLIDIDAILPKLTTTEKVTHIVVAKSRC